MKRTDATRYGRRSIDAGSPITTLVPAGCRRRLDRLGLNMRSMRSVMRKPPTTLMVAHVTAMKPRIVAHRVVLRARGHERADERDAADGVRAAHERRVEERRHARDDLVADERGEHEDVETEDQVGASWRGASFTFGVRRTSPALRDEARRRRSRPWVELPGAVLRHVEEELLHVARVHLARVDGEAAREVESPDDRHAVVAARRLAGLGELAVAACCSAARSTMTDPGFIAFTISAVTRTGARWPGMSAVAMTTSALASVLGDRLGLLLLVLLGRPPSRSRPRSARPRPSRPRRTSRRGSRPAP